MNRTSRLVVPVLLALALAAGCEEEKTCSSDQALCDGRCTTVATDRANCGACGVACGAGESCSSGQCVCPDGRISCGGACVDLGSDPAHCGGCGRSCDGALVCTTPAAGSTSCAASCSTGLADCGRACVDLESHPRNCGACGRTCGSNERCSGGRCIADLYLACYNSDEVREATGTLQAAGTPLPVAPGPIGLAWAGELLAVASAKYTGAETIGVIHFDAPQVRRVNVRETSAPSPDLQYIAEHAGVLYVSHASMGTLLVVTPGGAVLDEVTLAPSSTPNPNPQGIAFAGDHAYVALAGRDEVLVLDVSGVPSCAAGTRSAPCTSEVARVDVHPLASPTASAMPSHVAVAGGRAFVALWNLDAAWAPPAGSTGRLAAIRTDTAELDAAFAGTAHGLVDLGPDCLNPADVAVQGGTLYVTCGAFDYSNYPSVTIRGSGIVPVDVSGRTAQVRARVAASEDQAPGKLAFCGTTGYVADRNSGTVWAFDPASGSTTLGAGVELCPRPSSGSAYVADIACGR